MIGLQQFIHLCLSPVPTLTPIIHNSYQIITMGNCYNQAPPLDATMQIDAPLSRRLRPLKVLEEASAMPSLSKKVMNRLEEFQPFFKIKPSLSQRIYKVQKDAYYEGSLKKIGNERVFEGPGRLILNDGTLIESEFHQGEPFRFTRIFKPNGDYFIGSLTNQRDKSFGKVRENGINYEGGIWGTKPEGKGKETSSKYQFVGTYKNGMKLRGKLIWNFQNPKNLYSYQGGFEDNEFSGEGILIDKQGTYKGMFRKGKKHGKGQLILPNKEKVIGKFEFDHYVPESNSTEEDAKENQLPVNHLRKSTWND